MKVTDFMNEVARKADTKGTAIGVAETRRVIACTFDELANLDTAEAMDVISKSLAAAKKRQSAPAKKKSSRKK